MTDQYEAIIIGGGFYGLSIALYLRETIGLKKVLVLEKESKLMSRASFVNQARVHNGYHYPRSILTGYRSAESFARFIDDFEPAIYKDFDKYYAIASKLSKTNSKQFVSFCNKIDSPAQSTTKGIRSMFNSSLIDDVFRVKEYAFDSVKLCDIMLDRIDKVGGVDILTDTEVLKVSQVDRGDIRVKTSNEEYVTKKVFNCAYSQINKLNQLSGLPPVSLKHEVTEMCLIRMPKSLEKFSVTVMDGPFFSIMPFPSQGENIHTLSHVRYTPHVEWFDDSASSGELQNGEKNLERFRAESSFSLMKSDVVRFMPILADIELVGSIFDVKTVLAKSEHDDSRPILFKSDYGLNGYNCIMGGKIDNIYDVFMEIDRLYAEAS